MGEGYSLEFPGYKPQIFKVKLIFNQTFFLQLSVTLNYTSFYRLPKADLTQELGAERGEAVNNLKAIFFILLTKTGSRKRDKKKRKRKTIGKYDEKWTKIHSE